SHVFLPFKEILTEQDLKLSVLLSTNMMLISSSGFGFSCFFQPLSSGAAARTSSGSGQTLKPPWFTCRRESRCRLRNGAKLYNSLTTQVPGGPLMFTKSGAAALCGAMLMSASPFVRAQDVDRTVLPIPPAPFRGHITPSFSTSIPGMPEPLRAPKGAPNVLLILIDDAGYGQTATFGGLIPTPTLDALAAGGLRYNRFHVTALCSPTRAALLTGRNSHALGMGVITNLATDFPGYTGSIPKC